jgi:CTP-dependent riboflavin kinase
MHPRCFLKGIAEIKASIGKLMIKRYLESVFRGPDRSCCSPYAREIIAPVNLRDSLEHRDGGELDHAQMATEQKAKTAKALRIFRHKDKATGLAACRSRPLQ